MFYNRFKNGAAPILTQPHLVIRRYLANFVAEYATFSLIHCRT